MRKDVKLCREMTLHVQNPKEATKRQLELSVVQHGQSICTQELLKQLLLFLYTSSKKLENSILSALLH